MPKIIRKKQKKFEKNVINKLNIIDINKISILLINFYSKKNSAIVNEFIILKELCILI